VLKTNALYENLHAKAQRFREEWEEKIAMAAYRTLTINPTRGAARTVYLVSETKTIATAFWSAYARLLKKIEGDRKELQEKAPRQAKLIDGLLPVGAKGCLGVQVKKYVARSQRKLTPSQAKNFLKGAKDFCIRSRSGYRYKLVVRNRNVSPEFPLRTWNVILSVRPLPEIAAASKAVRISAQKTDKEWADSKKLTRLGRNSGHCGKDGKSILYCRIKKSKKSS